MNTYKPKIQEVEADMSDIQGHHPLLHYTVSSRDAVSTVKLLCYVNCYIYHVESKVPLFQINIIYGKSETESKKS